MSVNEFERVTGAAHQCPVGSVLIALPVAVPLAMMVAMVMVSTAAARSASSARRSW
jgi:hypothetical protein